jgi:predicted nuclease of predicted toxin-antitoxin system
MKLLIDMNLSPRWVSMLTQSGIEAAHWSTLGEPEAIGLQVVMALRQMANELDEGALLTVDANRTRLRILPLRSRR